MAYRGCMGLNRRNVSLLNEFEYRSLRFLDMAGGTAGTSMRFKRSPGCCGLLYRDAVATPGGSASMRFGVVPGVAWRLFSEPCSSMALRPPIGIDSHP
jgi:hypothetical protein